MGKDFIKTSGCKHTRSSRNTQHVVACKPNKLLLTRHFATFNSMQRRSFDQNRYDTRPKSGTDTQAANDSDNAELLEQLYQYQKTKRRRTWRKLGTALLITTLTALVVWQGYVYYQRQQLLNQIPISIRKTVNFPIYVPGKVKIEPTTASYSNGIFIYQTVPSTTTDGGEYTVSEQPKPLGFDASKYKTSQGLTETEEINLPIGLAISGKVLNRAVFILVTDKTLISIVSTSQTYARIPQEFAQNLVRITR